MRASTTGTAPFTSHKVLETSVAKRLKSSVKDHLYEGKPGEAAFAKDAALAKGPAGITVKGGPAMPPPAPPSTKHPVMAVKDFEQGDYVEPGDVVLMTRLGSFFAWLMRLFDNSDFAHSAMVFQTPRQVDGIDQTFLIETSMQGVEIVSLEQFLVPAHRYKDTRMPEDFVVGVKRLETSWARPPHRRMAAARMLHFIENEDYNFRLLAALASPRTRNIYFRIRDSLRGKAPSIGDFLRKGKKFMPSEFICSGFVQYAYVDMVKTAFQRGLIRAEDAERAMEDVIFCPNATMNSEIADLLACTPNFLAQTPKLVWKYLIHGGEVFHVTTWEEVDKFFRETLPARTKANGAGKGV